MLTLRPELQTPLVSQIVDGLRGMIAGQALKPGVKLPSIRGFAAMANELLAIPRAFMVWS